MKRLTCEMCGGTDLVKDGGVFVCQSCGCKYSLEEAKKMMIEGTVDVSGSTVKVDNEQKLANLRQLAERAKEEGDSETATKYFEQILLEDPNDWEANFYTIYYAAHNIKIAQIGAAATRVSNIVEPVLKIIKENIADPAEQKSAYVEVTGAIVRFSNMLFNNITSNIGKTREQASANIDKWAIPTITMNVITGDRLIECFGEDELAVEIAEKIYNSAKQYSKVSASYSAKARQLDNTIDGRIESVSDIKSQIKRKRMQEYWDAHPEEKAELEDAMEELRGKIEAIEAEKKETIDRLKAEKEAIPMPSELSEIDGRIKSLSEEMNSLGIFKGKEKKQLQAQIEQLTAEKSAILEKRNKEISQIDKKIQEEESDVKNKISDLRKRIGEIGKKLNSCGEDC